MEKLFKKYLNNTISPAEFEFLMNLISNEGNSSAVAEMAKPQWDLFFDSGEASKRNPELLQKIQEAIFLEERNRTKRRLKLYAYAMRIAAVLVIGLVTAVSWLYLRELPAPERYQTVSVPYGARTQIALPDGSEVWLNSGSTLVYSSAFSSERSVKLKGEGFFEVVKGKLPFKVSTANGEIQVLGTSFNVQAYTGDNFTVTLEKGTVRLTDAHHEQEHVLSPGEQITQENGKFVKRKVSTAMFTSWKDGLLIFDRELFPAMMERLERWYNVEIEYSATDFKGLWFTGTIGGETLTEVMDMVCKAAPVSYHFDNQKRIIKIISE